MPRRSVDRRFFQDAGAACWPNSSRHSSPPPSPRIMPTPPGPGGARVCPGRRPGVADQVRPKLPKLAALLDEAEVDDLAQMSFPKEHRARIHSTNPLGRLDGEVERRTGVVGIFPGSCCPPRPHEPKRPDPPRRPRPPSPYTTPRGHDRFGQGSLPRKVMHLPLRRVRRQAQGILPSKGRARGGAGQVPARARGALPQGPTIPGRRAQRSAAGQPIGGGRQAETPPQALGACIRSGRGLCSPGGTAGRSGGLR
jgi:hypothetical protein